MKTRLTLAGFDALCASGSRNLQPVGLAAIADIPNIFIMLAVRNGIRLPPAENVRAALIDGNGQCACAVSAGLRMMIGIKKKSKQNLIIKF